MISKHDPTNLPGAVNALAPKIKAPSSARVLNSWITKPCGALFDSEETSASILPVEKPDYRTPGPVGVTVYAW